MASSVPSSSPDQFHHSKSPNSTPQPTFQGQVSSTSKTDINMPDIGVSSEDMDASQNIQKFEKYHADYARYLNAKYFSGKNLYGGNIYEKEVRIDNAIVKASRWPCTRSFTDPVQSFEDYNNFSTCPPKAPMSVPNRKKCSS